VKTEPLGADEGPEPKRARMGEVWGPNQPQPSSLGRRPSLTLITSDQLQRGLYTVNPGGPQGSLPVLSLTGNVAQLTLRGNSPAPNGSELETAGKRASPARKGALKERSPKGNLFLT
jgi:hypothetical protein